MYKVLGIVILVFTVFFLSGCNILGSQQEVVENEEEQEEEETEENYDPVPIDRGDTELNIVERGINLESNQGSLGGNKVEDNKVKEDKMEYSAEEKKDDGGLGKKIANYAGKYYKVTLHTNYGDIKIKFYNAECPITVGNFLMLADQGFYNNTKFHRVIEDFMVQGGDPNSKDNDPSNDGQGGPGYTFQDEINKHPLVKGSVAMANAGPNTNGSQFFIVTADAASWLDGKHTNFGTVVKGMDVVEKIKKVKTDGNDRPLEDVVINNITLFEIK